MSRLLKKIDTPADLKKIPRAQLGAVADELRAEIIRVIASNGGHLGASLGTVELTVALHYVFNAPSDRIVWDVGHQAHGHKILTGRRDVFDTIRKKDGLSGFPSRAESEYDTFGVGHASTAISAALGMATARDLARSKHKVVAIVGDGALTGGIAFEGLNNAGMLKKDMLVILNDNMMSISKNVGALSSYLTKVTSGKLYNRFEADVWELLGLIPKVGGKAQKMVGHIKESIKNFMVPGVVFEELGFRYFGPIDGHNTEFLVNTLAQMRDLKGPILLHVLTQKGRGIEKVEEDSQRFHAVSSFDKVPGDRPKSSGVPSYTAVFSKTIVRLARRNKRIVGITAAMPDGTGLSEFATEYPERFFDVGIAEQHASTFAAGLATEGYVPMLAVYSTFLQRAYDQVIHDIGLQGLPVRFVMDRAGVVGEDGPTHHGVFDISYLRCVPNFVLMAPKDENECQHMLKTMVEYNDGPCAIRIPRGSAVGVKMDEQLKVIPIGKAEVLRKGENIVLFAYGTCVQDSILAADILEDKGIHPTVVNARFAKPLDHELLDALVGDESFIVTVEENVRSGGFGSAVIEHLVDEGYDMRRVRNLAIPDRFMTHAPRGDLLEEAGLSPGRIASAVLELIHPSEGTVEPITGESA